MVTGIHIPLKVQKKRKKCKSCRKGISFIKADNLLRKKEKNKPQADSQAYQYFIESEAPDAAYGVPLLPFPRKWRAFPKFAFPDIAADLCFSRALLAKRLFLFFLRGQIQ